MTTLTEVRVTDEQRRQLNENGFFITDVLFDDATLEAVRAEFNRAWQLRIEAARDSEPLVREQAKHRPFLPHLHMENEVCADFCRHPVFLELSRQLIGPDADMTWNQAIIKPPDGGDNAFGWHQDMYYAVHGVYAKDTNPDIFLPGDIGFTTWVAITRTTVDNGTLWVLPGRHKEGLLTHEWCEEKREWRGTYDTSWRVPAVMQAGQMLVFRKYLPHASSTNVSDEIRMAYQISYSPPGLKRHPTPEIMPVLRDDAPVVL